MKRIYLITGMVMFLTLSVFAQTFTLQFGKPQIVAAQDGFSLIVYDNCVNMGKEGTPEIPFYGAEYLLSPGHELMDVRIVSASY